MTIRVRNTSFLRNPFFYLRVLSNSETQKLMFDRKILVWRYLFSPKYECKYICQSLRDGRWKSIALAQISKGEDGVYWLAGAIPKDSFNSGNGLYAAVAIVSEFFKTHPDAVLKSGSFFFNKRAFRTTEAIGFRLEKKDDEHFESSITKEQFDNDFVRKIKNRINC